jgi:hypothetical protein
MQQMSVETLKLKYHSLFLILQTNTVAQGLGSRSHACNCVEWNWWDGTGDMELVEL